MTLALASQLQTRLGVAAIGSVAVVTAVAGTAYAAWTVSGSGSTTGKAASIQALTVEAAVSGVLYPGSVNAVTLKVTNPNVFPITVTGVSFGAVTSSDPTGCPASNVALTPPASLSLTIPAGGVANTSLTGASTMLLAAPDGCAGATFTLTTSVSGASV